MDSQPLDFSELLARLQQHGVRFIVAGGLACAFNGFVRATEDLDILLEASPENVRNLYAALGAWGDGAIRTLPEAEFLTLAPGCVTVVEDIQLDIFTLLAGKTFADYLPRARKSAQGYLYLAPGDLIATKEWTQREKDAIDVLALRRILAEEAK